MNYVCDWSVMNKFKKISKFEFCILLLIMISFAVALFNFNHLRFFALATDSAGYVDLIRAVAQDGKMVSPIFSSFYSVMPILAATSDAYCASPLASTHRMSDFIQWHPYLIVYALAIPVKSLGINALDMSAFINSLNIVASIFLIYWYLRKKGLMVLEILVFVFIIAISDYWIGAVVGQFYFDRLFLFPGLMLVLFCYEKKNGNYYAWLLITFLAIIGAILISERTALLTGLITFGYWLLLKDGHFNKRNIALLILGLVGLIYFFIYIKYIQNSVYYAGINLTTIVNNLNNALSPTGALYGHTKSWFVVVAPMLILSLVNWRYGLLVVAAMLPNLMVSVGGAEKTGFTTHYHAGYIPFLIGFAVVGYSNIINIFNGIYPSIKYANVIKRVLATLIIVLSSILVSNYKFSMQSYQTIFGPKAYSDWMSATKIDFVELLENIPSDEWISSPEWTMPTLAALGRFNVDYMPIGIGVNRFVIASYSMSSPTPDVATYLDSLNKKKISICIQSKLDSNYAMKSERVINGMRYIIYERRK